MAVSRIFIALAIVVILLVTTQFYFSESFLSRNVQTTSTLEYRKLLREYEEKYEAQNKQFQEQTHILEQLQQQQQQLQQQQQQVLQHQQEMLEQDKTAFVQPLPGITSDYLTEYRNRNNDGEYDGKTFHLDTLWKEYWDNVKLMKEKKIPAKVLIYEAVEDLGLGNKLPPMINCLVFAMLTKRMFVMTWQHTFPWAQGFNNSYGFEAPFNQNDYTWAHTPPTERNHWLLKRGMTPNAMEILAQKNLTEEWANSDIIRYRSGDWDFPLLVSNPIYAEIFSKNHGFGVFRRLAQKLYVPVDDLKEIIESKTPNFKKLNIGIQMRTQKTYDKAIILPTNQAIFDVAKMIQQEKGYSDADTAYYITSDDQTAVLKEAEAYFGKENIWVTELGVPGRYTQRGDLLAIVDMHILSRMNDTVITQGSSFGQVSSAMGGAILKL